MQGSDPHALRTAARQVLEAFTRLHPGAADLTHVNILAELLMEGQKWQEASATILRAHQRAADEPLPIDLQVSKDDMCADLCWSMHASICVAMAYNPPRAPARRPPGQQTCRL